MGHFRKQASSLSCNTHHLSVSFPPKPKSFTSSTFSFSLILHFHHHCKLPLPFVFNNLSSTEATITIFKLKLFLLAVSDSCDLSSSVSSRWFRLYISFLLHCCPQTHLVASHHSWLRLAEPAASSPSAALV